MRRLSVLFLTLCIFTVGSAELLVAGVLNDISKDLAVSISAAGLLVTVYAYTVAISGPFITILTLKISRKNLFLILMFIFVIGNFICGLSKGYGILVLGRMLSALAQGCVFAVIAVLATSEVDSSAVGKTIAYLSFGLNLSTVFGAPGGTAIAIKYGWHFSFFLIAICAAIFSILSFYSGTKTASISESTSIKNELKVLLSPIIIRVIIITILAQTALFIAVTYISPLLKENNHYSVPIWLAMAIFGVFSFIGNFLGGYSADKNIGISLIVFIFLLSLSLLMMALTVHASPVFLCGSFALVGLWGFAIVPNLQTLIIKNAAHAPTLSLATNVSAFNVGNGSGALLGSIVLAQDNSYSILLFIAAILAIIACLLAFLLEKRKHQASF